MLPQGGGVQGRRGRGGRGGRGGGGGRGRGGGGRGRGRGGGDRGRGGRQGDGGRGGGNVAPGPAGAAPGAPAIEVREEQYWENFRDTVKKHWCNFFEYHRRGLSRDRSKLWDDDKIPPIWQAPAEKSWDGRYPTDVQPALDLQKQWRVGYEIYTGSGGSKRRRKKVDAEAGAESVRERLAKQGVAVRLAKVLGWGGNGVASLFEVWPGGDNAPSKKVVVKSLLRQGLGMDLEWSYNLALRRARHIIQARFWGREIIPTESTPAAELPAIEQAWKDIDRDPTILTLEFMKNGDMHHLITKLAKTDDSVPQPILWRIFFCLVRGCIAMYSPPRSVTLPDGRLLPEEQWRPPGGPDLDETLPAPIGDAQPPGWNFIHYDLDPQNVLIGDTDDREHLVAPIFKISDLGLGKRTPDTDPDLQNPTGSWNWRQMGKIFYLLPEQYHKEWDYIQTFPPYEKTPPQVAGQYGPWSNIFQAALCMQNLITKSTTPYPPVAMGPLNDPKGAHLFDSAQRVRDARGNPLPSFYTHGHNLASVVPAIGEELLHVLLRCLADLPADRPSLWELNWLMVNKEKSPGWAVPEGDPDGVRAWCDKMFKEAPAPPASAEEASTVLAPEVPATASQQQQSQGPGNDRVPGAQGDDDHDDDDNGGVTLRPLGASTVIPETRGPVVSGQAAPRS